MAGLSSPKFLSILFLPLLQIPLQDIQIGDKYAMFFGQEKTGVQFFVAKAFAAALPGSIPETPHM